jgi:hypothetical protein
MNVVRPVCAGRHGSVLSAALSIGRLIETPAQTKTPPFAAGSSREE